MRKSRTDYYFDIVEQVAARSTCDRGMVGAIIVRDGRILSTGYAGAPAGMKHCDEIDHELITKKYETETGTVETTHCVRTVHAEINAIIQAAKYGPPIAGAEIYCTMFPCYDCAKAIVNAGIVVVHADWNYQGAEPSMKLFNRSDPFVLWDLRHNTYKPYPSEGK